MSDCLEDFDNELGQVFAEFSMFLYLVTYDSKNDPMLHNVIMNSQCTCIRTLSEFFTDKRKDDDDIIYSDFLKKPAKANLVVNFPKEVRVFINKNTAHLSKKRGKKAVPQEAYIEAKTKIVRSINRFIGELIDGNIKHEYVQQFEDEKVAKLKSIVLTQILNIGIINAEQGEKIDL